MSFCIIGNDVVLANLHQCRTMYFMYDDLFVIFMRDCSYCFSTS